MRELEEEAAVGEVSSLKTDLAGFSCPLWNECQVGIKWEAGLHLPNLPRAPPGWAPGVADCYLSLRGSPLKSLLQGLADGSTFSEVPKVRVVPPKRTPSPALEATELWPGRCILSVTVAGEKDTGCVCGGHLVHRRHSINTPWRKTNLVSDGGLGLLGFSPLGETWLNSFTERAGVCFLTPGFPCQ